MSAEYTGEVPCSKCGTTHWMHGECKKPTEVMITPSTIITAELLASLDKCPFCGAGVYYGDTDFLDFTCGTGVVVGEATTTSMQCDSLRLPVIEAENTTLRARVSELESKVKRLTEAGDKLGPYGDGDCECNDGSIVACDYCIKYAQDWTQAKSTP